MKLATQKDGSRDGRLLVVSRDLKTACRADGIADTLQSALDDWDRKAPRLRQLSVKLHEGTAPGIFAFDTRQAMAPLPRAYQWMDGSVYRSHFELMQKAFDSDSNLTFREEEPMVYQGGSDHMLGAEEDIVARDEAAGIDFEGEVAVITGDVPMGATVADVGDCIKLVMLANDVSLRNMILNELGKGFGFYQSKPASSFSPVAVTPEELGDAWRDGLVHLPLRLRWNNADFGCPNAGVGAGFNFPQLIAHAAKTRRLVAGSIVGSGTVSNKGAEVGSACISERRAQEKISFGEFRTPYLKFGDRIRIEMLDKNGQSIFGAIDQRVVRFEPGR